MTRTWAAGFSASCRGGSDRAACTALLRRANSPPFRGSKYTRMDCSCAWAREGQRAQASREMVSRVMGLTRVVECEFVRSGRHCPATILLKCRPHGVGLQLSPRVNRSVHMRFREWGVMMGPPRQSSADYGVFMSL